MVGIGFKGAQDDVDGGRSGPEDLFLKFIRSEDFTQIREMFKELCLGKGGVVDGGHFAIRELFWCLFY